MEKLKIDCHNHDLRSDWCNDINDFADKAVELWLDMCAITNHDVVDRDLKVLLKDTAIIVPEAVEISAQNYDNNRSLHLTSYANSFKENIDRVLEDSLKWKSIMLEEQSQKLENELWLKINLKDVLDFNLENWKYIDSLNRFSLAEYIYKWKYSEYNIDAIKKHFWKEFDHIWFFLNLMKKWWDYYEDDAVKVNDYEPSVEKSWILASDSNAVLSIAHPNFTFKKWVEEFEEEISYYIDRGVNGVEVNVLTSKEWLEAIMRVKKKYYLILTFGSDCHKIWEIDNKHHYFWNMNSLLSQDIIKENFYKFREKVGI